MLSAASTASCFQLASSACRCCHNPLAVNGNKRIRARLQRQKDRPIGGRMPIAARAISALPAQASAVSTNQNTARCRTPIYTPRVSAGLASIEQDRKSVVRERVEISVGSGAIKEE